VKTKCEEPETGKWGYPAGEKEQNEHQTRYSGKKGEGGLPCWGNEQVTGYEKKRADTTLPRRGGGVIGCNKKKGSLQTKKKGRGRYVKSGKKTCTRCGFFMGKS